jgi:transcriptional regulator with XRE-family HTH domain
MARDSAAAEGAPRRRSVFPGFADLADGRPPVIRALVSLRQTEGLSQADVARLMGTSQPAVARLESGTGDVRLSTLARYAEALGHDLAWDLQPRLDPKETP